MHQKVRDCHCCYVAIAEPVAMSVHTQKPFNITHFSFANDIPDASVLLCVPESLVAESTQKNGSLRTTEETDGGKNNQNCRTEPEKAKLIIYIRQFSSIPYILFACLIRKD